MRLFKRRAHRPSPPLPQDKAHIGLAFGQDNAVAGYNTGRRLRLPAGTLDLNAALTANNNVPANFFGILSLTLNDAPNYAVTSGGNPEIIAAQPNSLTTASSNSAGATGGSEGYLAYYGPGTSTANAGTLQISRKTSGSNWWAGTGTTWPKVTPGRSYVVFWGQLQNGGQQFLVVVDVKTQAVQTCYSGASNAAGVGFWYSVYTSPSNNHVHTGIGDFFSDLGAPFFTSSSFGTGATVNELAWLYGDLSLNGSGAVDAATVAAFAAGKLSVQQLARMSGMALKSYFRFDTLASGSVNPDGISPVTGTATVNVLTGSVADVVPGGQARAANDPLGLTYNDPGAGYVHRVTPGLSGPTATGTIGLSGNYLGRLAPMAVQARLEDASGNPIAGFDWRSIARNPRQGVWKGKLSRVPVGGPYYVRLRWSNRPEVTIRSANPQYIGLSLGLGGQSQLDYQWQYVQAGSSLAIGSEVSSALGMVSLNIGLSDGAPTAPNQMNGPAGHCALTPLNARNCPGTGLGSNSLNAVGDGMLALIKTLSTLAGGWPIMIVRLTKSGHAIETWTADRNATSYAVTASGTTYSANLATPAPGVSGASGYDWSPGFGGVLVESVKKGSLRITGAGVSLADDGAGNVTGTGGSGTIFYGVGNANNTNTPPSVSLTGLPANAALTIAFTSMQDTQGAQEVLKLTLNEFTSVGDGVNPASGILTATALRLTGPLSVIHWDQGSGNLGEFGSAGVYARGKTSYTSKLGLLIAKYKAMGVMDAATVFSMGSHFREGNAISGLGFDAVGYLRRGHIEIAAGNSLGIVPGGDYYDMDMYDQGTPSGHPSNQPAGAQRMGEREAYAAWAAQTGDPTRILGPAISGVTFVDGKNIDVTFSLPAGDALTTNAGRTSSGGAGPSGTGTSSDGGLSFKYVCAAATYATGGSAALGAYTTVANTTITNGLNLYLCSRAITTTTTTPSGTNVQITDGSGTWSFQGYVQPFANNLLLAPSMFVSNGGNIYQVTAVNTAVATVAGFRVTGAATADRCDGTGFDGTTGTTDGLRFGAAITAGNKVRITRTDAGSWTQGSITLDYAWGSPFYTGYTIDKWIVDQVTMGQTLYDNRFGGASPYGGVPGMPARPTTAPFSL